MSLPIQSKRILEMEIYKTRNETEIEKKKRIDYLKANDTQW